MLALCLELQAPIPRMAAQVSEQVQSMLTARPSDFQVFFDAFMVVAFRADVMDGTTSVVCSPF